MKLMKLLFLLFFSMIFLIACKENKEEEIKKIQTILLRAVPPTKPVQFPLLTTTSPVKAKRVKVNLVKVSRVKVNRVSQSPAIKLMSQNPAKAKRTVVQVKNLLFRLHLQMNPSLSKAKIINQMLLPERLSQNLLLMKHKRVTVLQARTRQD